MIRLSAMPIATAATLACAALLSTFAVPVAAAEAPAAAASSAGSVAAAPFKTLAIAFVDADLTPPIASLPADQQAMLADWKVADIGPLVKQRAAAVLAANGLQGEVVAPPARAGDGTPDAAALPADRPLLVLGLHEIVQTRPRLFVTAGRVSLDVRLYAADAGATTSLFHGFSGSTLGFDPVYGVLKTNRVDAKWVDAVVAGALDLLATKGLVQLPGARAAMPKD